jgi:exodeoxyribonuclease-3
MPLTICTWNINSARLREGLILRLLREAAPDVLCLQETKSPAEKLPREGFRALGYEIVCARGDKGYNGVAILSRIPLEPLAHVDFCGRGDARHCAALTEDGIEIHNVYLPAGGDEPDRERNWKFAHKLDFVAELHAWGEERLAAAGRRPAVLVGDLNIAPGEDDVWSHKQLLNVVSHTPLETEAFEAARAQGGWSDVTRRHQPEGKLYSWWSYRARDWAASDRGRRLDHVWACPETTPRAASSRVLKACRGWTQPSDHVPVVAVLD